MLSTMTRLRFYRAILKAECDLAVDEVIAKPWGEITPEELAAKSERVDTIQKRIRLINARLDQIIAADPRVLQPA